MRKVSVGALFCASLVCTSVQAVPITYDFTGSGNAFTYTGVGTNVTSVAASFTGTLTIDVNPAGPSGPDSFTNGSTLAQDANG